MYLLKRLMVQRQADGGRNGTRSQRQAPCLKADRKISDTKLASFTIRLTPLCYKFPLLQCLLNELTFKDENK